MFWAEWRTTTSADHYLAVRVVNRRPWPITLRRVDIAAKEMQLRSAAVFDVWGDGRPPDVYADSLPYDPDLRVEPGQKGGVAVLADGKISSDIIWVVQWWDNGHKPKLRTSRVRIRPGQIGETRIDLEDKPAKRDSRDQSM